MNGSEKENESPLSQVALARTLSTIGGRIQSSVKLLSTLSRLTAVPVNSVSLREAAASTLEILVNELGEINNCSILLFDEERDKLTLLAARGQADFLGQDGGPYNKELAFESGEGIAGKVYQENEPRFWYRDMPEADILQEGKITFMPESLACLPLSSMGLKLGVMNISFTSPKAFTTARKRDLALLAGVVANVIQTFLLKSALDGYAASLVEKIAENEREIAERKRMETSLRESEQRHRTVLEASPEPVLVFDPAGRISYLNPAFTAVFGWGPGEKEAIKASFAPPDRAEEMRDIGQQVCQGRIVNGVESQRATKDGRVIDVSISAAGFFDAQGELSGWVATFQDITDRKLVQRQLEYLAYHDALTGLPNRKAFQEKLQDALTASERREGDIWALFFLDLDGFKQVNDTLGHDAGDDLLKEVARRIKGCLRKSDHLFRLGGDEFTVIAGNLGRASEAALVAEKIIAALCEPVLIKGNTVVTSASIGIGLYPDDGRRVEELIKNADLAMYAAKRRKNRYRFYSEELNLAASRRIVLEKDLEAALGQGQLTLFLQPVVDDRLRPVSLEVLVRWRHPERGLLLPESFLPVAEQGRLAPLLDRWVLRNACQKALELGRLCGRDLPISVNFCAATLRRAMLPELVSQALAESGLDPKLLVAELQAPLLMSGGEQVTAQAAALRELGISLCLDDFGAGQLSLERLVELPVQWLKLEMALISRVAEGAKERRVTGSLVAMAHNLSMVPIAKGVENDRQQKFLLGQGCYLMQGRFFSPALASEEILAQIKKAG